MAVTVRNAVSWGMKFIDVSNENHLPPLQDDIVSDKYAVSNVKTLVNSNRLLGTTPKRLLYSKTRVSKALFPTR
jgi:hypothetical protein